MSASAKFVAAVEALIGTPFLHQGREPAIGLDCVGVPMAAAEAVGHRLLVPEGGYSLHPQEDKLTAGLWVVAKPVGGGIEEAKPGDILQITAGRQACHCGVYVGANVMVHANRRAKKVCRSVVEPGKVKGVWRLRFLHG